MLLYRTSLLVTSKVQQKLKNELRHMVGTKLGTLSYADFTSKDNLKSLTRYRFDKVKERAKLKTSVSRLVCILFPELETLVPTLHMATIYTLLLEYPGAKQLAAANLTHLKTVLYEASKGRYGRDRALNCGKFYWFLYASHVSGTETYHPSDLGTGYRN